VGDARTGGQQDGGGGSGVCGGAARGECHGQPAACVFVTCVVLGGDMCCGRSASVCLSLATASMLFTRTD
jgi:hypothetical protein